METIDIEIKGELQKNEPLSKHTSFGIGGPADIFASPADRQDLTVLLQAVRNQGLPYFIIGSGTNLLVRDGGFRGVVISLRRLQKMSVEREYRSVGGAFAVVYAQAGVLLSRLLAFAAELGFTGLEFATGIPGTVGGAVCMNAGAAGGEIGDIIESVDLILPDGEVVKRRKEDMGFGYRSSSISEGELVLDARVVLRRDDVDKIKGRVKELLEMRKQLQPLGFPNAGSMFRNPLEESAGKLIEAAGLKGKKIGDAQVSEQHANYIVNVGAATARDVLQLMKTVQETVLEVHGVRLEPEIKIIGED